MKKLVSLSSLIIATTAMMVGCASQQEKQILGDAKFTPIPRALAPESQNQTIPSNPGTQVIPNATMNNSDENKTDLNHPESNKNQPFQTVVP
ncbi:hypothetical protein [Acinetobacter rudis]|uniref:Lipoprotein n=1 Tax=Acinetobacter rudis CIP 110305 TaxID=421052 RepID=S3NTB5_9GAMM|nr:hypothetical protein [Acinetobacter rudis]EPF81673.1 hypothetical protein F945_00003 [Acinetobacter rudis CIP 110305]